MLLGLAAKLETAIKLNTGYIVTNVNQELIGNLVDVMLDFPEKPEGFTVIAAGPKLFKKVILVSGGADSSIMWWLNRNEPNKLGLYVDLGHTYVDKELNALQMFNIPFSVVKHPLKFDGDWKHIIPTRNFVLIAEAAEYVQDGGEIWVGAVSGESSPDKGDKSDLFFDLVEQLIYNTTGKTVTIRTLKDKTKNDWLKQYLNETNDLKILNTITCFDGTTEKPCGKCQACLRKWISLLYCGIDTNGFFEVNPYFGGNEYVQKYKNKMRECLATGIFEHYTKDRCEQDLKVIEDYERGLYV